MSGKVEKRRAPRIQPYVAPCRLLHAGRRLPGYLVELGAQGARVSCEEEPPAAGELLVLEVRFSRRVVHSPLPAEVKWTRASEGAGGRHLVGLTFRDVSAQEQRVLDEALDEFRRRAALLS